MKLNWQKGLRRLYGVISGALVISAAIIAILVWFENKREIWLLTGNRVTTDFNYGSAIFVLMLAAVPWLLDVFVRWIIRGFAQSDNNNAE